MWICGIRVLLLDFSADSSRVLHCGVAVYTFQDSQTALADELTFRSGRVYLTVALRQLFGMNICL